MADQWTRIQVTGDTDLSNAQAALEAEFLDEFEDGWESYDEEHGVAAVEGWSKYQLDGIVTWAEEFTNTHPLAEVQVHEEWTGEGGPLITDVTYAVGAEVSASHNVQVPTNLDDLIRNVRQALDSPNVGAESTGRYHQPTGVLLAAVRALIDGLDPEGKFT